jgi:hypothetical protein
MDMANLGNKVEDLKAIKLMAMATSFAIIAEVNVISVATV